LLQRIDPMTDIPSDRSDEIQKLLHGVRRHLVKQTIAMVVMGLVLLLLTASVYGSLVNYFAAEPLMYGSTLIAATAVGALLGFGLGWFVRGSR
jgi:hypothetical protein